MPTVTYGPPTGLLPSRDAHEAFTDAVRLAPGSYSQGQAIGEYAARAAANEVQTVTFTGTPTGGTYRLAFNGVVSGPITYSTTNATHQANVQAALDAMSNVGAGNATAVVTSSGTVVTVTFGGTLGGQQQPPLSLFSNSLTGGSSPTATVAETTPGAAAGATYGAYDDAATDGRQVCRGFLKYAVDVLPDGTHQTAAGGSLLNNTARPTATAYFTGTFYTSQLVGLDANGAADVGRMVVGTTSQLAAAGSELRMS